MSRELDMARELVKMLEEKENAQAVKSDNKTSNMVQLSELMPGDRFETEIGKMIVLGHDEASGTTKVIQDNFFEEDVEFDEDTCDYTKSALKKKFDGEIAEAYTKAFRDALVEHEVHLISVDMQDYGTFKCKVRPITFDEAREFNQFITDKDLPDWWWTCTPWSTEERGYKYSISVVCPSGLIRCYGCYYNGGVRPFCILKSNIFVSKGE